MKWTLTLRRQLALALSRDETLPVRQWGAAYAAARDLPLGTPLPEDLTDVGDGTTPAEIVAVALDYYGLEQEQDEQGTDNDPGVETGHAQPLGGRGFVWKEGP